MPKKVNVTDLSKKTEGPDPVAHWTMLVYLAGDNNLTAEMVWGLQELKKTSAARGLEHKGINIVAHFDPGGLRSRRYDIALVNGQNGAPGIDGTRDGNLDATVVYTERFIDAELQGHTALAGLGGPGRTLTAFVMSQIAQLPDAKRFMVVLSGHGSGAEGDFLIDTDPTTSLSIPELGDILSEARRVHYEKLTEKDDWKDTHPARIAILGMDSCLMSNVEVCYEIRNSVNYIVASEGFVENTGWPYHRVIESLLTNDHVEDEPLQVSKKIARSYADFYRDYEISGVSTDIAVCRLEVFRNPSALVAELEKLATSLIPKLEAFHARRLVELAFGSDALISNERKEQAEAAIADLASEIARKVGSEELEEMLLKGSKDAEKILESGDPPKGGKKSARLSAEAAVVELNQSLNKNYRETKRSFADIFADLPGKLSDPVSDPAVALALVRARRELDPGVRKALTLIEDLDAHGKPDAKPAREMLLNFHHIRLLLELAEFDCCKGGLTPEDYLLVDALVAARWEAQSFKGGVYVDLHDFCERIERKYIPGVANLNDITKAIRSEASAAVADAFTTGVDFQHARGLSVYFPVVTEDYTPKYMNLEFAKETGWGLLVRAYLEATRRPRRDEDTLWFGKEHIRRYKAPEIDPLRRDEIEARIVGIEESVGASGVTTTKPGKGGTSDAAKGGTSDAAKGGTSDAAKGKRVAAFGNQPDGFRRIV